jgi:hypothetical protein
MKKKKMAIVTGAFMLVREALDLITDHWIG